MILSSSEYDRMCYLLGKFKVASLTSEETNELRSYVVKEQLNAQGVPIKDLVDFGLIIVGIKELFG